MSQTSVNFSLTNGTWDIYIQTFDNAGNWINNGSWDHYIYTISTSYEATDSSYASIEGNPHYCCWHISSANGSYSSCSQNIVDYQDGSGNWECDVCSSDCKDKTCPNGGTLNASNNMCEF